MIPFYDYFYGSESEQFSFYRIPKLLFLAPEFKQISVEAKVLYGLLLDRMSLSAKNGWLDEQGRVYIIFSIVDIMEAMGCADQKAGKLLQELEQKAGLIARKRQGLGKPNLIYVKNFLPSQASRFKNRENHDSGNVIITDQEPWDSRSNNTESNKTENNELETSFASLRGRHGREPMRSDEMMARRADYENLLKDNISYEYLLEDYPKDHDILEEILALMVDTVCSTADTIRIAGDSKPAEVVRSAFLKLTDEHIRYVLECLRENTTRVRDMKHYLLATLYNAGMTISTYYDARVRHDLSIG